MRALDAFAFSSALVASAAAALAAAASRALGIAPDPAVLALAFSGSVVVYCVDRVRDLAQDAYTSPLRSAFVSRHRRKLLGAAALCAPVAVAAGVRAGTRALALCGAVAALGFAHRRLKRLTFVKPFYLTGSWGAVCVGLPAVAAGESAGLDLSRLAVVLAIVCASVHANVILSNLRDAESIAGLIGARRARGAAAAFCAAAIALALFGPSAVRALVALPLAMGAAVAAFRPGERYGALVVDGALLVGGLAAYGAG
jgi:hypothetical protein